MAGRSWGYWTRGKLDVLRAYLDAFTTATKNRTSERIYLDLFAGEVENHERLTDEHIDGSARVALNIEDPPFSKLRFFELESNAAKLEAELRGEFPGRDIIVYGGDCNERIHDALTALRPYSWAPTFAFVDPNGMQAAWSTLAALADFRRNRSTKVEMFILFAAPMFIRVLPVDGSQIRSRDADKLDLLFGSAEWRQIYEARLSGVIGAAEAREQYLNFMRWRLESVLGYEWTHPLEICNTNGSAIYYMIFATDHEAGTRIMSSIYANAAAEFPAMRERARRRRQRAREEDQGLQSLFSDVAVLEGPVQRGERFYEHFAPEKPWFLE